MTVKMMHRTFEEWKKLDKPEFWSNNIDELNKAREDRFFIKRHEEYLANRTMEDKKCMMLKPLD